MDYKGIIIEESLKDSAILQLTTITSTKVEKVTKAHKTPWLAQWTLHTITVPADKADSVAERLSGSLAGNHWYVDYRNRDLHYIIFPNRVFRVARNHPEQYETAKAYGIVLGIPDYQLTFSAEISEP